MKTLINWTLMLMLLPSMALAADATLTSLQKAQRLIADKEHEAAIALAQPLLDDLRLDSVEKILMGHKVLGAAKCELGDQGPAKEHFGALLTFSPEESMEGFFQTRPCLDLFEKVQKTHPQYLRQLREKKLMEKNLKAATALPETAALDEGAQTPAPQEPRGTMGTRLIPFGTGQFLNGNTGRGVFFALSQGFALGGGVGLYAWFRSERNPDGTFSEPRKAQWLRNSAYGLFGVAGVSALLGVLDATITFQKRRKAFEAHTFQASVDASGMVRFSASF